MNYRKVLNMNIGQVIKNKRLELNYTQEQLANLLNVSRSTISSWEVGRNYPDLETIILISDLLNISLDELMRKDKDMTTNLSNKIKSNKKLKIIIGILLTLLVILSISLIAYNKSQEKYRYQYRDYILNKTSESSAVE